MGEYRQSGYADCFCVDIATMVSQEEFVKAFYTTPLFKVERLILKWAVSRPSTDDQATKLAAGTADAFAAWRVEKRNDSQLLLCDFTGRTRSWLMASSRVGQSGFGTRLYFGSAVVPVKNPRTGQTSMGPGFSALLGFHKIYSRLLLQAAKSRLEAQ